MIFDQAPAGTLDNSGGKGQTVCQILVVFQHGRIFLKVVRTLVYRSTLLEAQLVNDAILAQSIDHLSDSSPQDLDGPFSYPIFRLDPSNGVKGAGRFPQVFQDMDEIQDKRHIRSILTNTIQDAIELLLASVNEYGPRALLLWITPRRFSKHILDDVFRFALHTGSNPFFGWPGTGTFALIWAQTHDRLRTALMSLDVVNSRYGSHTFAIRFLSGIQQSTSTMHSLLGSFARCCSEVPLAHDYPLLINTHHQNIRCSPGFISLSIQVECIEILGSDNRELFQLSFGDLSA